MAKLITIFGATGRQGGSVANALLKAEGYKVRAVTRKPKSEAALKLKQNGAEVIHGDLEDKYSRLRSLEDAYGCFCVTRFWPHMDQNRETKQGIEVALACKEVGIQHFIYSGLESVKRSMGIPCPHFDGKAEVEDFLQGNDIPFTSVRIASYLENFISGNKPEKLEDNKYGIFLPMGYNPMYVIPVAGVGECVHQIFNQRDRFLQQIVGLASDRLTVEEMADIMTKHVGVEVIKGKITLVEYSRLKFAGAKDLAHMFEYFQAGKGKRDIELTKELNPKIQKFEEWVIANAQKLRESLES